MFYNAFWLPIGIESPVWKNCLKNTPYTQIHFILEILIPKEKSNFTTQNFHYDHLGLLLGFFPFSLYTVEIMVYIIFFYLLENFKIILYCFHFTALGVLAFLVVFEN